MRNHDEYTPREFAVATVIAWIKFISEAGTDDLYENTSAFNRQVIRHLRKMHNRLLENSTLHGVGLDEENDPKDTWLASVSKDNRRKS